MLYVKPICISAEIDTCQNGCDPADVQFQPLYLCLKNGSIHHIQTAKILQILMIPLNKSSIRLSFNTHVRFTVFQKGLEQTHFSCKQKKT